MTLRCLAVSICLAGLTLAQNATTPATGGQAPQGPRGRGPNPGFGRGPGRGPGPGMRGLDLMAPNAEVRLTKQLNLNSTQQNSLHQTISTMRLQQEGASAKVATLRTQLGTAIKGGDESAIDRITGEISTLNQQQTGAHAKAMMAVYGSLSAKQKTKFEPMLNRELGIRGPRPNNREPQPGTAVPQQ